MSSEADPVADRPTGSVETDSEPAVAAESEGAAAQADVKSPIATDPVAASTPAPPNGTADNDMPSANKPVDDVAEADPSTAADTPSATQKGGKVTKKRSSIIPEHKSKKASAKAKKEIILNLDCQPGDFYFARMKGHPEWPAVVADEAMLPEQILGSRPVTARRSDYSYRDDYGDDGKNAKDRTYPVMFLGTNEFAWMVNSDLRKMAPEEIETGAKVKNKALLLAYEVAKKRPSLEEFKDVLWGFEKARVEEERIYEEKLAADEKKQADKAKEQEEPKAKKTKRKSTAIADEDAMDVDEEEPEAPKPSKKRKKSGVEPDEEEKPAKTPKIKLNAAKTANGDSATKAKPKPKTPKAKPAQAEPVVSESEQKDKIEKSVLYLRHKLQKGFLQSKAPGESEMPAMASHFETLQQHKVLEGDIIRATKIHKVLKAILKLDVVPLDDKYHFKKQSNELLAGWNKALNNDTSATPNGAANGAKEGDAASATKATKLEDEAESTETPAKVDADASMTEAKDETEVETKVQEVAAAATATDGPDDKDA